jgi:hypothetical protein
MTVRRLAVAGAMCAVAMATLTGCNEQSLLNRPAAPVVLTAGKLNAFAGVAPNRVVAFRRTSTGSTSSWTQIPVQVDQRKTVAFGSQPPTNATAGVTGTVYGYGSGGPTALQYADPNTWVGADPNPNVDADDEIVFMASDAGGRAGGAAPPAGVVAGSGVAVTISDPRASSEQGWVYLFRSTGSLDPSAGQDYVDYDFTLKSGDYKSTYKRADGPNPETSKVTTATYSIDFTDRWKEVGWKVLAPGASGVDILDGHKNQFAISSCGRSNQTFTEDEGAFVANIDGPVRAIRSYVGANSGPLTQRTHLLYRDREDVITNLRVHPIPGIMDFLDYSAAASGMTYRSSTVPGGVLIDGHSDAVGSAVPTWEALNGPQGRVYTRSTTSSSQGNLAAGTTHFYRDLAAPAESQCWGDRSYYGASGTFIQTGIANTDPRSTPTVKLTGTRINQFLPPAADPSKVAAYAADWAADAGAPLTTTVSAYPG